MSGKNQDTISLLQECSAGCKMAMDSIAHMKNMVKDEQLLEIMNKYYDGHSQLEAKCRQKLNKYGNMDKEANVFAKAMANVQSSFKMLVEDDKHQAASILTDGCNMGIKSISGFLNEYKGADQESSAIAEKLRRLEENMIGDLQPFL